MRKQLLALICCVGSLQLPAQAPPAPYGALPSKAQLQWQEQEMYCIIHFGMNTYTNKEWGYGDENPAIVNPSAFNAKQIVSAAKAGGFKGVVIVAKHHDGFCLWPTKTTTYNISKSPWNNGRADMVKEYQRACQVMGMQMGLYCSPWDRNASSYGTTEYINIYRAQLKELYSNYDKLFMSWHDGANGGDGYYGGARTKRTIDRTTYYGWDTTWALTRHMQPGAAIFGDIGPDVRWVGNEEGIAGETCWATYTPQAPDEGKKPSNGYSKYWEATTGTRNGAYWMPAECDVPLRPGWFYHKDQDNQVKTPAALLDLYYKSVGRGACLDLGLAPDQRGILHENDVQSLAAFGRVLKQTFAVNLLKQARLITSNIRGKASKKYGTSFLTDADRYSYWATDDTVLHPQLTASWQKPVSFNVIRLRENSKLGQRVTGFAIDAWQHNEWKEIAVATSIGANRLVRLPELITTDKLRLRITGADACIALSDFGLFREAVIPELPATEQLNGKQPLATAGWKLMTPGAGAKTQWQAAFDNNNESFAHFPGTALTIDLGALHKISAFTYLPRQDRKTTGIIDHYTYSVSTDGIRWQQVAAGEFANIAANPIQQVSALPQPVPARYIRLEAVHVISGNGMAVAELGILL